MNKKKPEIGPEEQAAVELIAAYEFVGNSEQGRKVLAHILAITGYHTPILAQDPNSQEINERASLYNAARRSVWIDIRQWLSHTTQAAIENAPPPRGSTFVEKVLDRVRKIKEQIEAAEAEEIGELI